MLICKGISRAYGKLIHKKVKFIFKSNVEMYTSWVSIVLYGIVFLNFVYTSDKTNEAANYKIKTIENY